MKKLYILSGIPGSGKSSWSQNFKNEHPNTFVISSDDIRMELGGKYQYFDEEDKVWELFNSRAQELCNKYDDVNVILDSTCLKDDYRLSYVENLKGFDKYILVLFICKFKDALKLNNSRPEGRIVPYKVMKSMKDSWRYPTFETKLKFDEIIEVILKI